MQSNWISFCDDVAWLALTWQFRYIFYKHMKSKYNRFFCKDDITTKKKCFYIRIHEINVKMSAVLGLTISATFLDVLSALALDGSAKEEGEEREQGDQGDHPHTNHYTP